MGQPSSTFAALTEAPCDEGWVLALTGVRDTGETPRGRTEEHLVPRRRRDDRFGRNPDRTTASRLNELTRVHDWSNGCAGDVDGDLLHDS